jgi:methionine-rich copper-binding protein CopC
MRTMRAVVRCALTALACAAIAVSAVTAFSKVTVSAVDARSSVDASGAATATFKVAVANGDQSPISQVFVVFADGSSVALGDIDGGKTGVSDTVTVPVDLNAVQSRNSAIKVTLKYRDADGAVEASADLRLAGK